MSKPIAPTIKLKAKNMTMDPRIVALVDVYVDKPGSRWRSRSELGNALFVKFLRAKRVKGIPAEYLQK